MNELEMEIGRTLGASAFFVYQTIKSSPRISAREIQIETGLSENCVQQVLVKLRETKVVNFTAQKFGNRKMMEYTPNEERETWKFH